MEDSDSPESIQNINIQTSFNININIRVGSPRTTCRAKKDIRKPPNEIFNTRTETLELLIARLSIAVTNSVYIKLI